MLKEITTSSAFLLLEERTEEQSIIITHQSVSSKVLTSYHPQDHPGYFYDSAVQVSPAQPSAILRRRLPVEGVKDLCVCAMPARLWLCNHGNVIICHYKQHQTSPGKSLSKLLVEVQNDPMEYITLIPSPNITIINSLILNYDFLWPLLREIGHKYVYLCLGLGPVWRQPLHHQPSSNAVYFF